MCWKEQLPSETLEEKGAQVLTIQIDNIKKDQISLKNYTLEAGEEYAIIAIGDQERIQDIDLAVLDKGNNLVGKDSDDSNVAIVKVTPSRTQSYSIGVKGYKMSRIDGFYAIIICRFD